LLELISKDFVAILMEGDAEVQYLGTSLFRGELHDHIAVSGHDVDMQLWIAAEGRPLPTKMALSSKWETGAPRFVTFISWDTSPDLSDDSFKFVPPVGATEINFIPKLNSN